METVSRVLDTTYITQPYHINGDKGYNYDHWGIDLVCFHDGYTDLGWIEAHSDGTVVETRNDCYGFESGSYGNYVLIRHDNGYYTMYAHGMYGSVQVWAGQRVTKGQTLMYMGNTGESYGGHLHFEIRRPDGYKIDPEFYLNRDLPGTIEELDVDGKFGYKTISAMQRALATDHSYVIVDGEISGQIESLITEYVPCNCGGWDFSGGGSICVQALQEVIGVKQDGLWGGETSLAFAKWLNDRGYDIPVISEKFDEDCCKAYQRFLNDFFK